MMMMMMMMIAVVSYEMNVADGDGLHCTKYLIRALFAGL